MAYHAKALNQWAIRTIEKEAPEDVDILIGHPQWNVPEDGNEIAFNYFIPNSDKGFRIARDFIIEDIGYDFWAMPWERLEHIATLRENLTTALIDGTVLWSRTDEVKQRFRQLQDLALTRLSDISYRYQAALYHLDQALDIYKVMMFDDSLSHVRKGLSAIAEFLSNALGTVNGIYFKRGPEEQDRVLDTLEQVPEGFTDTYRKIPYAKDIAACRQLAHTLISAARRLLAELKPPAEISVQSDNYEELAAWYEEGAYWFRRLYSYTRRGEAAKTLQWGYSLQAELDYVTQKYGLEQMNILDIYDPENLMKLNRKGHEVQQYLRRTIIDHGVKIREYNSLADFLNSAE